MGRSSARLIPEDRLVAQRFICVGLEMLLSGGSVMPAHVSDQLGSFVGVMEANSKRRLPNRGDDELEAWQRHVSKPLESLLRHLMRKGLLEREINVDGETCSASQEALPCLTSIWRYIDPSSNRSGFEDALRRAVNRFQRSRPSFCFGKSVSLEGVPSYGSFSLGRSPSVLEAGVDVALRGDEAHLLSSSFSHLPRKSNSSYSGCTDIQDERAAVGAWRASVDNSRCSTPGSTTSSMASSSSRHADLRCTSKTSTCSTALSLSSGSGRSSECRRVSGKQSLFQCMGNSLIGKKM